MDDFKTKADRLAKIIKKKVGANITSKSRMKSAIDGRKIFSKIMRDDGYTLNQIGEYLNKNHTSIIHYCKVIEWLMDYDKEMVAAYGRCCDEYYGDDSVYRTMSKAQLVLKLNEAQKKIKDISNRYANIYEKERQRSALYERFDMVFSLIAKNTPVGKEDKLYTKVKGILNGI